jgi:hypothetical protein
LRNPVDAADLFSDFGRGLAALRGRRPATGRARRRKNADAIDLGLQSNPLPSMLTGGRTSSWLPSITEMFMKRLSGAETRAL